MRILGVDPGITRCGIGVIDATSARQVSLVDVGVIRTDAQTSPHLRLATIYDALSEHVRRHRPDTIAVERVFAEANVRSVMSTAQVAGIAMLVAAQRGCHVEHHSPSEVKAAITGDGLAHKKQIQEMVRRILGLEAPPKPADAADALALAICHAWRGAMMGGAIGGGSPAQRAQHGGAGALPEANTPGMTAAQRTWITATREAKRSGAARRPK